MMTVEMISATMKFNRIETFDTMMDRLDFFGINVVVREFASGNGRGPGPGVGEWGEKNLTKGRQESRNPNIYHFS